MKVSVIVALFVVGAVIAAATVFAAQSPAWRFFQSQPQKDTMSLIKTAKNPKADAKAGPAYSRSAYDITHLSQAKIDELAKKLKPEEAKVILRKGTEPPFCGNLYDNHKDGAYVCKLCGLPLFRSDDKFESGTGWPSFFQPFDRDHVAYISDSTLGMARTEILCARCDAHLGHVFDDGPKPTSLRYCLNSVSLDFVEKNATGTIDFLEASRPVETASAYFGGGCFWGTEDRLQQVPGVVDVVSGYQGGTVKNPTYKQVCNGDTNHAEVVRIVFDPKRVTYLELLAWFFKIHDPTQLNRQGPDYGTQYRSAVFADGDEQYAQAKTFIEEIQKSERFKNRKIVTQLAKVADAGPFYAAEDYHQDYHEKHGGSCALPAE